MQHLLAELPSTQRDTTRAVHLPRASCIVLRIIRPPPDSGNANFEVLSGGMACKVVQCCKISMTAILASVFTGTAETPSWQFAGNCEPGYGYNPAFLTIAIIIVNVELFCEPPASDSLGCFRAESLLDCYSMLQIFVPVLCARCATFTLSLSRPFGCPCV